MSSTPPPEPPGGAGQQPAQRHWQAPCPNCGAAVEFRSAASASAVCSYCRSTVVRDGETLRKIGRSAQLFDDHSPLQLGAAGRYRDRAFTLIGRLQWGYGPGIEQPGPAPRIEGSWNEWYILFDDDASAWLSEDNDQYVVSFDVPTDAAPPADQLVLGRSRTLAGKQWQVASRVLARVLAAQGELPRPPQPDRACWIVELRNVQDQVATLDYTDPQQPQLSVGQAARLAELALSGLRGDSGGPEPAKAVAGRSFDCPSCGAPVSAQLESTRCLTCGQCHSVIDLSQGIGAELQAWQQAQGPPPALPLGRTGLLSIADEPARIWQIVGYAVKRGYPQEQGEHSFSWNEYLLFNQKEGFAFLVESEEGWVGFRTITGAPRNTGVGTLEMSWKDIGFDRVEQYPARVVYVEGEFYWLVEKDQGSKIADYAGRGAQARYRLSREETGDEIVWSFGRLIPANQVANAFRLSAQEQMQIRKDIAPTSGSLLRSMPLILAVCVFLLLAMMLLAAEMDDNSGGPYFGVHGGSWGGISSAGGHK
ncbi:MAG: DUF4178 domain-containing protein [Nevskia sp.]|nr:DUF4178 domain-containing protein [Nevskia sp.]